MPLMLKILLAVQVISALARFPAKTRLTGGFLLCQTG